MKSIKFITTLAIGAVTATLAMQAQAHRAWILPSSTVLSSDAPYVTFDAAISNTLFFPDHFPMNLDGVAVMGPTGAQVDVLNPAKGKYRSTFDLQLKEQGTYKIASASAGLRASWQDEKGERQRWPQRGKTASDSDFSKAVPKDAQNLSVYYYSSRVETFVTAGTPSKKVFKPTNKGLEIIPNTHPNDLYSGEKASFTFMIDGQPAKGVEIEIIPGGMRYRNSQDEIIVTSDENGQFSVTWPSAGRYFLEARYEDGEASAPATKRIGNYSGTFEVLPM